MTITSQRRRPSSSLLARLVEAPDLVATVRAMPAPAFTAAIREIGVEDAGPLVAAASPAQLVAAFDEDLFRNARPGEREAFDPDRFVAWLEVMLEAGDEAAAARLAELSEDFVLRGLGALVRVLDHDALRDRMLAVDEDDADAADAVEKALESSLVQEIDGYLLVSREGKGWDAALAVILALDRDHRALLERLLERAARQSARLLEDFETLAEVLSEAESLAEDVEAEREERRGALGFVEPRAARAFLELARQPADETTRDALTAAYFRALPPAPPVERGPEPRPERGPEREEASAPRLGPGAGRETRPEPVLGALRQLHVTAPAVFHQRMEELTYLANVLVAGASDRDGARLGAADAAQAALATVALGAELAAGEARDAGALRAALERETADLLFRRASAWLAARGRKVAHLSSLSELEGALEREHEAGHEREHEGARKPSKPSTKARARPRGR
jgi:hypothetical protein